MKKLHSETIGTFVLIGLISISVLLTGSLWFDNYQGLFLLVSDLPIFNEETEDYKLDDTHLVKDYTKPFKVTIINGESGKWLYYASSTGADDGYELIKSILKNTSIKTEDAMLTEWDDLKNRKSVIYDFGGGIDISLFELATDIKLEQVTGNIESIAITKAVTGGIIYIKTNDKQIYRIQVDDIKNFDNYIYNYSNQISYAKFVKLEEIGTNILNSRIVETATNAFLPMSTKQNSRRVVSKIIESKYINSDNLSEIEKIVQEVFNNNDYIKFITSEDSYIFINDDESIVKFLEGTRIIEYTAKNKNLEKVSTTMLSSFNTGLNFINKIDNSSDKLYLISAIKSENVYQFAFGTYIDDIIIADSSKKISDEFKAKIYIEIENNKVMLYRGYMTNYSSVETNSYISQFGHNILDDLLLNVPKESSVMINSVDLIFDIKGKDNTPVWITDYTFGEENKLVITQSLKEKQ